MTFRPPDLPALEVPEKRKKKGASAVSDDQPRRGRGIICNNFSPTKGIDITSSFSNSPYRRPSRRLFLAKQATDHTHRTAGATLLLLLVASTEHVSETTESKTTKELVDTKTS